MTDEIIKRDAGLSTIDTLRLILAIDGDDALSIAKTAVKDGSKGLVARSMSVFQRWNEVRFGEAFLQELEDMRSAGRIRDDFSRTDAGVSSLKEFFEMIDGKPDEARFQAFCALFMAANAPNAEPHEGILDVELMGIMRKLSAGEMHLLSALLRIAKYEVGHPKPLMHVIADELGYRSDALVRRNIAALIENSLIDRENWTNQGGSTGNVKPLLTDLGIALQERVHRYNEFKNGQGKGPAE